MLFLQEEGLRDGFGSGASVKSLSWLLWAWISPAAVAVVIAKLEVWIGPYAKQAQVEFNASDGGGPAARVGWKAVHELVGDRVNDYSQQNGGFIEHAGGAKVAKKQAE